MEAINTNNNANNHKKLSLFAAIMVIIGGDMGIGIYFKNISVFKANDYNGYGILISWLFVAFIVICNALCFGEIATCKVKGNENAGLAGWAERFLGRWMGRFLAITTPIMYLSFFAFSTSLFAAEALTNTIVLDQAKGTTAANQLPIGYIVLIGLGILTILISINFFSHHFGTGVAKYTSFAKFLPLFTIIIMGIFFGFIGGTSNFFNSQTIPDAGGKNTFSPTGILKSCPAIMFSFDGFLIVGSITNKINNSKRNIPLAILIAMAFSAFVYILITTAEIILGVGNAFEVFEKIGIKSNEWITACNCILSAFMFIAAFGVVNSMSMAALHSCAAAVDNRTLFASEWIIKKSNGREMTSGLIVFLFVSLFFFLTLFLPSIILNTDMIVDGATSTMAEFYFIIYGLMSFACAWNRKTNKVEVIKTKGLVVFAFISGIGFISVGVYTSFYEFFINAILKSNEPVSWGLLHNDPAWLKRFNIGWGSLVFWCCTLCFVGIPLTNDALIKLSYKFTKVKYNQRTLFDKYVI